MKHTVIFLLTFWIMWNEHIVTKNEMGGLTVGGGLFATPFHDVLDTRGMVEGMIIYTKTGLFFDTKKDCDNHIENSKMLRKHNLYCLPNEIIPPKRK